MRVVVGLGNPGSRYTHSRHNIGFAVVEELSRRWSLPLGRTRNGVRMAEGVADDRHVALIEPQMYMNVSGPALARIGRHITAGQLIVIHDDLDLDVGCVRVKVGGGTAGHHGLDSIVDVYGADFVRVRVGIGRPRPGLDTVDYVLSEFDARDSETIGAAVVRAADAIDCIIANGEKMAMNVFNTRTRKRAALPAETVGRN